MTCTIDGCKAESSGDCQDWGVGQGFCDEHIGVVRARFANRKSGRASWVDAARQPYAPEDVREYADLIEDYVRLYALMLDKPRCRELMSRLNTEIAGGAKLRANDPADERFAAGKRKDDQDYARLSRVLEYYEGLCWFPIAHRLYTGPLTSENYQESIALGYMPKDAGAGSRHGEYSHRLQWHIVMRVVTDDFSGAFRKPVWRHSPLELFIALGAEWAQDRGLWGSIFDNQDGLAYDNPAILNEDLCGNFRWRAVAADDTAKAWRKEVEMLSANAERRTRKRLQLFNYAKFWAKQEATRRGLPVLDDLLIDQTVLGIVERWKKLGKVDGAEIVKIDPRIFRDPDRTVRSGQLMHDTAVAVMQEFKLQAGKAGYVQDPSEQQALLGADDQLINATIIKGFAAASRLSLNGASYAYAKNVGAYAKYPRHQMTEL